MGSLVGQVIVVTGASSGLGEQIARAVSGAGGLPVLAARRQERLNVLCEEIPRADCVACDVTDEEDRRRLIDTVVERHGRLDGLVNIYSYPHRPLIIVVYAATVLGGELCGDEECLEARLFSRDNIPWEQLAFQSTNDALRDYLAGRLQPF